MYRLASCCLLFIGFLHPLSSLPVTDSRDASLQLPGDRNAWPRTPSPPAAPEEDVQRALEELERASILRLLPEALGMGRGAGLREADPTANISNPRDHVRKALPGQDPNVFLSHLLARARKQHKQHGPPAECFWKYCV